jgi:ribosomal protein S18 acetylase RimI-like enzyme
MAGNWTRGRSAGTSGTGSRPRRTRARAAKAPAAEPAGPAALEVADDETAAPGSEHEIRVRRMHRRDANRVWEFLKLVFRAVNKQTVEYQRPRSKQRFLEQYDDEGIEQLLFEIGGKIVGYAECAFEVTGSDNWINPRYFDNRDMRPMFVEEVASHPDYHGRGIGSFILEQLQHLARVRGCTHLVLEVAENNRNALAFYRKRNFFKLDAAIFLAKKVPTEPELLPPRPLPDPAAEPSDGEPSESES